MDGRYNGRANGIPLGRVEILLNRGDTGFMELFYSLLKMPQYDHNEVVNIGYVYPHEIRQIVLQFMDYWVYFIDKRLDALHEETSQYLELFRQRGFTLNEFRNVLSGKPKEEDYKHERIFDYLFITDKIAHDFFISSYSTNADESYTDKYLSAIGEAIKLEIPLLNDFFFNRKLPVFFPIKDLNRHTYILAETGSGKSELMKLLFYDLQKKSQKKWDRTMVLIEPHTDLSYETLRFVLNSGIGKERIVYLDPFIRETAKKIFGRDILGQDYTFVINPFEVSETSNRNINYMTQELSSAFFEILKNETTTQMEAVIEACIETLLWCGDTSIADLKRFMDDSQNEDLVSSGTKIPNEERSDLMRRFRDDSRIKSTKSGIYYRLQSIIGDRELRRLLVGKSTVNLDKEINSGKVLICNLSKGSLGKKSAGILGKLIIALIQGFVRKRQTLKKENRKETFLFIDEFQNFITPTIEEIMTESRKFAMYVVLAHQVYGHEMDASMRRIIMGNTAIKVAGDNEEDGIKALSKQMPGISPKDFENLPKYGFFVSNKANKKMGAQILNVPDFLVKTRPPFYMNLKELEELFLYLVHDSGYYIRLNQKKRSTQVDGKTDKYKTPGHNGIYIGNFID